jgi:peptidylprolyl isomerase
MVEVHYSGWTTDGKMFDSSVTRGKPTSFPLNRVIKGWTEGLQLMVIGEKTRFWIPEELAYKGKPGRPQGMLVFDVELLEIKPPAPPDDGHGHGAHGGGPKPGDEPAPPDVAAPPKDAKKSPKGVFYKILTAKKGAAKPTETDTVRVNYTGWQTTGLQFDSSKGHPVEFSLQGVIPGWTDGLQMMGVGEKARFWIPEELAYQGADPKGMLVFDVEMIEIKPKQ